MRPQLPPSVPRLQLLLSPDTASPAAAALTNSQAFRLLQIELAAAEILAPLQPAALC